MLFYNDERDYLLVKQIKNNQRIYVDRYLSKRSERILVIYNNIKRKSFTKLSYVKVTHAIDGREVETYEFYNINAHESLKVNLRSPNDMESQSLYIHCIFSKNNTSKFYDVTNLISSSPKTSLYHLQFKKGNIEDMEFYYFHKSKHHLYYMSLILLIIIILYIIYWLCKY